MNNSATRQRCYLTERRNGEDPNQNGGSLKKPCIQFWQVKSNHRIAVILPTLRRNDGCKPRPECIASGAEDRGKLAIGDKRASRYPSVMVNGREVNVPQQAVCPSALIRSGDKSHDLHLARADRECRYIYKETFEMLPNTVYYSAMLAKYKYVECH